MATLYVENVPDDIYDERSVYDSLDVALAVRMKSQLITADEGLANALAAYLPVKWLGRCSFLID